MAADSKYDVAIIGGGLAGLALSILSARAGYQTILFEKEKYPFHKVCGEYISFESWNFLEELGIPLSDMQLPAIHRLIVSSPSGKYIEHALPMGGFGISRYTIDKLLADLAIQSGVNLMQETKVVDTLYRNNGFMLFTSGGEWEATVVAGAFGKRSNLDVKWKRSFTRKKPNKLNHYLAVKYHIKTQWPSDLIALHNFMNGYCGISQVEENKYCLCYLTTAHNLIRNKADIRQMEKNVLYQNPFLKKIFQNSSFLYEEPLAISRISFNKKTQVENHVLMLGDAAGLITPLCGNGMSMALHSGKLAFEQVNDFLKNKINRFEMEQQYTQHWEKQFARRMMAGRMLQRFFGSEQLSGFLLSSVKPFPSLVNRLISFTHGQPY